MMQPVSTKLRNTQPSCFKNNRHGKPASRCIPIGDLNDSNYNFYNHHLDALVSNKANIDDAKQHLKDFAEKKLHESTSNTAKESTMQIPDDDR